ncbi:MAG: YeeE/YedE family protein [Burkholderiaceae bacterium]|nr:YeeE/YedE family protein [Burkholderiaceae bacterium]
MQTLLVFISGLVFGIGLIISGMSNPAKVINFLDIAGNWDPSLAFVMLGAIPVAFVGFRFIEKQGQTAFHEPLHLPGTKTVNRSLVIGGFVFGAGWAIAGFCPGPALVALGAGYGKAFLFVAAMLAGMLIHDRVYKQFVKEAA